MWLARAAFALATIAFGIACGVGNPIPTPVKGSEWSGVDFGPLAVRKPRTGEGIPYIADAAGPIDIGRRCVTLRSEFDGQSFLLVWWANQVRWLPDRREIAYFPAVPNPTPVMIRDGDRVILPPDNLDPSLQPEWVSPPDESCEGELHDTLGLELANGD